MVTLGRSHSLANTITVRNQGSLGGQRDTAHGSRVTENQLSASAVRRSRRFPTQPQPHGLCLQLGKQCKTPGDGSSYKMCAHPADSLCMDSGVSLGTGLCAGALMLGVPDLQTYRTQQACQIQSRDIPIDQNWRQTKNKPEKMMK